MYNRTYNYVRWKPGRTCCYEQELLHDIRYFARGRGFVKESEIFAMTSGNMLIGVKDEWYHSYWSQILNALQSHYIFESIKRIIEIDGSRVIVEPELTPLEQAELKDPTLTRQDMETAGKIKKGIIKVEPRKIAVSYEDSIYRTRTADLRLLRILYGLDDGIIKPRRPDVEEIEGKHLGQAEEIMFKELQALRAIYKAHAGIAPLVYVDDNARVGSAYDFMLK